MRYLVRGVRWVSGSGPGRKRIRLNRGKPCTPRWFGGSISSTCLDEIASCWFFQIFPCLITLGGVVNMLMGKQLLLKTGLGVE